MVLGDADCCAKCGHGEIWHPTCCQRKSHRFVGPLVIEGKVLLIGDRFYYNFEPDKDFPNDPKGWIQCRFSGGDSSSVIVKPKGFEKFSVNRSNNERFSIKAFGDQKA
jgi:hypothetical protein